MRQYIIEAMEECGLARTICCNRYPHQFSGGQRQRIGIARSAGGAAQVYCVRRVPSPLWTCPSSPRSSTCCPELKEKAEPDLPVHHPRPVAWCSYITDRICVMYLGNVVELADAEDHLRATPRHPYTVALLSSIPTTEPDSGWTRSASCWRATSPAPSSPRPAASSTPAATWPATSAKRVPPELREVEPGHFLACHFPKRSWMRTATTSSNCPRWRRSPTVPRRRSLRHDLEASEKSHS